MTEMVDVVGTALWALAFMLSFGIIGDAVSWRRRR